MSTVTQDEIETMAELLARLGDIPPNRIVHTSPEESMTLTEDDTLDGVNVLPGITLPVRRVFEETEVVKKAPRRKRRDP